MKPFNSIERLKIIQEAKQKYNSYGSEWEKAYFDELSGGYLVVDKNRIEHSKLSNNEKVKFDKEYTMCIIFAQNCII